MTEMGMGPERQGWFAGVKAKVAETFKRFSVAGAKEHFYKQNADFIKKVTANMTPEQRQQAYADIEQDALASAKTDVAVHWGAAVVGTTAAVFGFGILSPRFQQVLRERGGRLGENLADRGQRAHDWLRRVIRLPRWHGSSGLATRGRMTSSLEHERQQMATRRVQQAHSGQGVIREVGRGVTINPNTVTEASDLVPGLERRLDDVDRRLRNRSIVGQDRVRLEREGNALADKIRNLGDVAKGKLERNAIRSTRKVIEDLQSRAGAIIGRLPVDVSERMRQGTLTTQDRSKWGAQLKEIDNIARLGRKAEQKIANLGQIT